MVRQTNVCSGIKLPVEFFPALLAVALPKLP
jgi:hypothetical protein